jgi:ureidoacrylate peracid hydrolase
MTVDVFSSKKLERQVRVDPKSTGIIVVDMLNEFCKPGGAMVLPGYEVLIPPQKKVIEAGRQAGCPIVFVVDTHRANMRQEREFLKRTPHCLEGSWGAQIVEELKPHEGEHVIVKRGYDGFANTTLDTVLRNLGVTTCVVVGVMTGVCVSSTVRGGVELNYHMTVINPTFATGRSKSPKPLIFCGGRWLGRHHSAGCHSDLATSAAVTLGGGWAGKLIFNRWSRMA